MQKVNDTFLARLRFDASGVKHYDNDIEFGGEQNVHCTGHLISGIVLTNLKLAAGKEMPEIPDLAFINNKDFDDDTHFTISGYPEITLNEDVEQVPTKNKMYSSTGECLSKEGETVACKLLTSKGQNGGGVTFTESGQLFGIYTDVIDHPSMGEKLGMCCRITQLVVNFVNDLGE